MARTKISEFSATPANNTDIDSINIAEGCAPSGINDAIRELMSQLKDFQTGAVGDSFNGPVGTTTPAAGAFTTLSATGNVTLGDASTDTLNVGNGGLIKDASGNLGLGVTPSAWFTGGGYKVMQIGPAMAFDAGTDFRARISANGFVNSSGDWRYINTGFASNYTQVSGQHQFFTAPSGAAGNAITFTQAMTLDASGNMQIGTTTSAGRLTVSGKIRTLSGDIELDSGQITTNSNSNPLRLGVDGSEKARIDSSGNLLVGTTAVSMTAGGVRLKNGGGNLGEIALSNNSGASDYVARFLWGSSATLVGNITVSSTATSYNTSSDYRLKNTISPMTGALAKVALLKPCTYKWNADGSDGEGFIAHELAEVVPQCVTGEKDAVDEDGNPKYQGIDTSFLVATLTAAIQEQQAIIESLKARLDAANL